MTRQVGSVALLVVGTLVVMAPAIAAVIVGHPVPVTAAGGTGLAVAGGYIDVADVVFHVCGSSQVVTYDDVDTRFDLGDDIHIPAGEWCGMDLVLDGPIVMWGTGNSGGAFYLSLDAGTIEAAMDPAVEVDTDLTSDAYALRLASPGWITGSMLGLRSGVYVTIDAQSQLHDGLRDAVLGDSAVLQ